jgi:hypothetical protein
MKLQMKIVGLEQQSQEVRDAVHAGVEDGIEVLGWKGVQLVQDKTPVAFGILANGITVDFAGGRNLIAQATIHATPPSDQYVLPVETGTRPHFPPITPLMLWVKKKFGVNDEQSARSIAFAIAKKISKVGTKGAFMFRQAEQQLETLAPSVMERSIAEKIIQEGLA